MGTSQNRLGDAVLTTTTFYVLEQKLLKKMNTPVNPCLTIEKLGGRGCSLHGHVIIMHDDNMPMQKYSNFNDCKKDDFQLKHCDTSLFLLKQRCMC